MSATGSRVAAMAGFTLLELLVVIAIMAIGMALVPPMLAPGRDAQSLKIDLRQVISGLRFARTRAIVLNTPVALSIDLQTRQLGVDNSGKIGNLHAATDISLTISEREWQGSNSGAFRFYPDGGSSGGELLLSNSSSRYHVFVDWLTGDVTAVQE